jgi:hypothetical protein
MRALAEQPGDSGSSFEVSAERRHGEHSEWVWLLRPGWWGTPSRAFPAATFHTMNEAIDAWNSNRELLPPGRPWRRSILSAEPSRAAIAFAEQG